MDTFNEGYHIGFLHQNSLQGSAARQRDGLRSFWPQSPPDFSAQKAGTAEGRARRQLGPDVEHHAGLSRCSPIPCCLFRETMSNSRGSFRARGVPIGAVMELGLYVPKAPSTDHERTHWDKNMQLVLDVVTGEDFPTGRSIQIGLTSGAQDPHGLRPQRAGDDPLSPVDADLRLTLLLTARSGRPRNRPRQ